MVEKSLVVIGMIIYAVISGFILYNEGDKRGIDYSYPIMYMVLCEIILGLLIICFHGN